MTIKQLKNVFNRAHAAGIIPSLAGFKLRTGVVILDPYKFIKSSLKTAENIRNTLTSAPILNDLKELAEFLIQKMNQNQN